MRRKGSKNFTFSQAGVPVGSAIIYVPTGATAVVVGERSVKVNDEIMTIAEMDKKYSSCYKPWKTKNRFSYGGKTLDECLKTNKPITVKMSTSKKGKYHKISEEFIDEMGEAFKEMGKVMRKFGLKDGDTALNSYKDSVVAKKLGFTKLNVNKHGWDASVAGRTNFLEVKQCSLQPVLNATFNDTSVEKAMEISNVHVALGVWKEEKLCFIVHGKSELLGEDLMDAVLESRSRNNYRPGTQSKTVKDLIEKYGFTVMPIEWTPDEVTNYLLSQCKTEAKRDEYKKKIRFDDEAYSVCGR